MEDKIPLVENDFSINSMEDKIPQVENKILL